MDIDIDFFDRSHILNILPHRISMRLQNSEMVKHNTGIYFQEIPHNPFSNIATIDYKTAESVGYFKIDLLNVSAYAGIKDEEHLDKLINQEPIWELLEYRKIVEQLFHINNHYDIVKKLKPTNIEQLAAVLAIIRPAKRYLLSKPWNEILQNIWIQPEDSTQYFFKKSHAYSYAQLIIVQLNLICENIINGDVSIEQIFS
jgi:hypothetical protein